MKRKIIIPFLLLLSVFYTFGQVTEAESKLTEVKTVQADSLMGWNTGGVTSLTFGQTALVNWAAGGENSLASNVLFSLFANYKDSLNTWDNSLNLGYGFLKQKSYSKGLMKTDDRIDFVSIYGRKAFEKFYYAGLINFRTQFAPGYDYPNDSVKISDFMAPGYFLTALGLNYKPDPYFSAFIAPVTGKFTFVYDDFLSNEGAFGVEKGKNIKTELGGYIRLAYVRNDFENDFLKNISIASKLDLFSNYLNNPQNIDVNWENLIGIKVNKFITVNLNTILIYDDDVKIPQPDGRKVAKLQFKEVLGVGFSYNF